MPRAKGLLRTGNRIKKNVSNTDVAVETNEEYQTFSNFYPAELTTS